MRPPATSKKLNILVVYCNYAYPLRATLRDLLYCFRDYSDQRVFYLNLAFSRIPFYYRFIQFDLIVFHTLFLNANWKPRRFKKLQKKVTNLKDDPAIKIAMPQDEFYNPKALCQFINDFNVQHVFSVQPEKEWKNIYRNVNFDKVKFHRILTAYNDENLLSKIDRKKKTKRNRNITIGYRTIGDTNKAYAWYGRHGQLKVEIAKRFQKAAISKGVTCDISYSIDDIITGNQWYWFLLDCKYVLGMEGGTSILDWDGRIHDRTKKFVKNNPQASVDEIEKNCFPGLDGKFEGFAISPRHFEACATETCQILLEGEYNNILKPDIHYIPINKDFSNIDQILDRIINDRDRKEIIRKAYADIVTSGKYTYNNFIKYVIETSLPTGNEEISCCLQNSLWLTLFSVWSNLSDRLKHWLLSISYQIYCYLRRYLPY